MIARLMRRGRIGPGVAVIVVLQLFGVFAAAAQERGPRLQFNGGIFNVGKSPTELEAGLELSAPLPWWRLDLVGGVAGTDEGAVWGYLGAARRLPVSDRVGITPTLGLAVYDQGDGKDLGSSLHFRSALGVDFRLAARVRIGVTLQHLSNAGFEELNPGANSAVLTLSFPLGGRRGGSG